MPESKNYSDFITLQRIDKENTIWVTSDEDQVGTESVFKEVTNRNHQMLIALCEFLGYDPKTTLCFSNKDSKKVLILDKNDDFKPNFILEVPEKTSLKKIQNVIDEMEGRLPCEYDENDLFEALHDTFGSYPERFEKVIW